MYLHVRGSSPVISRAETYHLLMWAGRELMSPQLLSHVRINFEWKKYPDEKGHCEEYDLVFPPRFFAIACSPKLSRSVQRRTMFHEMVHVKQYAYGELKSIQTDKFARWKKKLVDEKKISYYKLPWEKEAYRLEAVLYKRYMEHLRRDDPCF